VGICSVLDETVIVEAYPLNLIAHCSTQHTARRGLQLLAPHGLGSTERLRLPGCLVDQCFHQLSRWASIGPRTTPPAATNARNCVAS